MRPCITPGCPCAAAQGDVYCDDCDTVRNIVFENICEECGQHVVDCICAERAERDEEIGFFQGEEDF